MLQNAGMRFPDDFPIAKRWLPRTPDRLQLYSLTTPNGVKASIMLEETGLPYEAHYVDLGAKDQKTPEYLSLNPNGRIPAIIDPDGPGRQPLALFESGAILQYLAMKTGMLLPADEALAWQTIQWVYFQVGHIGPMFGQVGYYSKFEGRDVSDPRVLKRFADEAQRLFGVLNDRLAGRKWMMGEHYTIADIAIVGMVRNFVHRYEAGDLVGYDSFTHVEGWLDRMMSRPAVQRGLQIPARPI